jgi:hypothetical protein
MKEFSQHLKSGKPNLQKSRGRVVQPSYVRFSLLKTAISVEGGKLSFMGTSSGKWPTNKEAGRNYDATCYAYKHSITSRRVG